MQTINPSQWRLYTFVCAFAQQNNGRFPTYQEIMDGCGLTTQSVVGYQLNGLVEAGLLITCKAPGARRWHQIAGQSVVLPVIAAAAAAEWEALRKESAT